MRRIVHFGFAAAFGSLVGVLTPNVSAPANAADLPPVMPVKALPAVALYNWTGLYVGAQGGYQSGTFRTREYITSTGLPTSLDEQHGTGGWVGGVHAGYNFQTGSIVWGVEADIETADLRAGYRYTSGDGTDFTSGRTGAARRALNATRSSSSAGGGAATSTAGTAGVEVSASGECSPSVRGVISIRLSSMFSSVSVDYGRKDANFVPEAGYPPESPCRARAS